MKTTYHIEQPEDTDIEYAFNELIHTYSHEVEDDRKVLIYRNDDDYNWQKCMNTNIYTYRELRNLSLMLTYSLKYCWNFPDDCDDDDRWWYRNRMDELIFDETSNIYHDLMNTIHDLGTMNNKKSREIILDFFAYPQKDSAYDAKVNCMLFYELFCRNLRIETGTETPRQFEVVRNREKEVKEIAHDWLTSIANIHSYQNYDLLMNDESFQCLFNREYECRMNLLPYCELMFDQCDLDFSSLKIASKWTVPFYTEADKEYVIAQNKALEKGKVNLNKGTKIMIPKPLFGPDFEEYYLKTLTENDVTTIQYAFEIDVEFGNLNCYDLENDNYFHRISCKIDSEEETTVAIETGWLFKVINIIRNGIPLFKELIKKRDKDPREFSICRSEDDFCFEMEETLERSKELLSRLKPDSNYEEYDFDKDEKGYLIDFEMT